MKNMKRLLCFPFLLFLVGKADGLSLTLEEKVGQVLMAAMDEETLPRQQAWIQTGRLGGVLLRHDRFTAKEVLKTTNQIQEWATSSKPRIPVWVAVDHEGGAVFTQRTLGSAHFPSQMAIAASPNPDDAYLAAFIIAQELRSMGVHIDFAPVLDVNNNPDNPVIAIRSYGENPESVARLGIRAVHGFQNGGVLPVGKHFPGHGDTRVDSHLGLPIIHHTLTRLEQVELYPFRKAIRAGLPAVMTAHIVFPVLTGPELPATLSPAVLIGVLRKKLGFKGMIVTDSMDMGAITGRWPVSQAATQALQEGADLILIGKGSLEETHRAMVQAFRENRIPLSRLNEAVNHVVGLKRRLGLFRNPRGNSVWMKRMVGSKAHWRIAQGIADRSITLLKNGGDPLPWELRPEETLLLVLSVGSRFRDDAELLAQEVKKRHPKTEFLAFSPDPSASEIRKAVRMALPADKVLVGTFQWGKALQKSQVRLVKKLMEAHPGLVAAALMNPYDVRSYPEVRGYLVIYGITPCSMKALAKVLFGEFAPRGKLPVGIPGLFPRGSGLAWKTGNQKAGP